MVGVANRVSNQKGDIMTLKEFRKKKGFNQKQMAKEIGVSASYYCKVDSYEFMVKLKGRFPDVIIDEVFF